MNTNSTITINTGKTTIKIIPDSDNGKAAILKQSSGKTTNFTIINCKDGELGKHITSFLTKNNIVNQNVIKIISNALLHNNKLSIYTNSNHSINATYFCKNGDVYDDYDNEDEFNENICAALAATETVATKEQQLNAIKNFNGVEHRLEFVRELNGVRYYNDSIGTSPASTIAGLNAFDENIVLLAGGSDKGLDYKEIGEKIAQKVMQGGRLEKDW